MQNSIQPKPNLWSSNDLNRLIYSQKISKNIQNQRQIGKITNKKRIIQSKNFDLVQEIKLMKERISLKVLNKHSSKTYCQSPQMGSDDFKNVKQKILRDKQGKKKESRLQMEQLENLYELYDLEYLTFGMIKQNPKIVSLLDLNKTDIQKQKASKSILRRRLTEKQSL